MNNTLKFKPEWFAILNRRSAEVRDDVIAAVTVYFYTGAEPDFTDDARCLAFDFIRHEIDTSRSRSRKNRERQPADSPELAAVAKPADPEVPADELTAIVDYWNEAMEGKAIQPFHALEHGSMVEKNVRTCLDEHGIDAVRRVIDTTAASKHFNENWGLITFPYVFNPDNFLRILLNPLPSPDAA